MRIRSLEGALFNGTFALVEGVTGVGLAVDGIHNLLAHNSIAGAIGTLAVGVVAGVDGIRRGASTIEGTYTLGLRQGHASPDRIPVEVQSEEA